MKPLLLCILDGWGVRPDAADNAITQARTPNWDHIWTTYPKTIIQACEEYVGLPKGQMGNSEVGHVNLGAGRVVLQTLPRIDKAFYDRTVQDIPAFCKMVANLQASGSVCHVMGLLSPGGVHSHQSHLIGLVLLLSQASVPVVVHTFLDGRDVPPQSAKDYMEAFLNVCQSFPGVSIGTVSGRYYAMDRDNRWDRTELAYQAIVNGKAPRFADALEIIDASYRANITDEFIRPHVVANYPGIQDGDAFLIFNFRADRVRQLLAALVDPTFDKFQTRAISYCSKLGMASYSAELDIYLDILFPPETVQDTLGEVISKMGRTQLRIAETEKYAHVTFFFNGGQETRYDGEERILVPSPKVATYDLKPEMAAFEVTVELLKALDAQEYDFIVLNYANADMVGHSGIQAAAEKAVEALDQCLGQLMKKVIALDGTLIITADHGNVEQMQGESGAHTAHTMNPVPFVIVSKHPFRLLKETGKLADVAPTVLQLMKIKKPAAMTGESLILDES